MINKMIDRVLAGEAPARVYESVLGEAKKFNPADWKDAGYAKEEIDFLKSFDKRKPSWMSSPGLVGLTPKPGMQGYMSFPTKGSDSSKFEQGLKSAGFTGVTGTERTFGTPTPGNPVGGEYVVHFNSSTH